MLLPKYPDSDHIYYFYRILTLYHKIDIKNSGVFLDYIYTMDVIHLKYNYSPFIWVDYLFIDDDLINYFIKEIESNSTFEMDEFEHISEFSIECLEKILSDGLFIRREMNHLDYIPQDAFEFYDNHRCLVFAFIPEYKSELLSKKRNQIINQIIN